MARMIPPLIHPSVKSLAERKLFEVIANEPGTEDWVCLHSLALARHDSKRRGEIDFLLLTRKGVFALEVKGGRVAREGGLWVFTNRWGQQDRKSEGPYDQASRAMFSLEEDLKSKFGKDHRLTKLLFGYGVVFPDIVFEDYGVEGDSSNTYDARDRKAPIGAFVDRLSRFARARDPRARFAPTDKDIQQLVDFLRGDFDMVPSLGVRMDDVNARLVQLTREQYAILDAYDSHSFPRLVVQGGAGTGKTMLAVEGAVRESAHAKGRILFLCFNRLLAAYLDRVFRARGVGLQVEVLSVYSFLNRLIKKSSLASEFEARCSGQTDAVIYGVLFPEFAGLAAIENESERFDTVVIDEGQDFLSQPVLAVLDVVLNGSLKGGRWRVFCDINNQGAVYGKSDPSALNQLLENGRSLLLSMNRRNSREIAHETTMLSDPRVRSVSDTPGVPVEYLWFKSPDEQLRLLRKHLRRIYESGVSPGRVTVLSPRSAPEACFSSMSATEIQPVTEENVLEVVATRHRTTTSSTISAFKGLENDYIVLVDVESLGTDWWRSVIYVGMSRARAGLSMLLPESLRATYESCLRRSMQTLLTSSGLP